MSNVKRIDQRVYLKGGLVNFEGDVSANYLISLGLERYVPMLNGKPTNNVKYCKHCIIKDEAGNNIFKAKISYATIKLFLLGKCTVDNKTNDNIEKVTIKSASVASILRGYMKTAKSNVATITKSAGIMIGDAIQICNGEIKMEQKGQSGEKDSNSIFHETTVGEDLTYRFDVVYSSEFVEMIFGDVRIGKVAFHEDYGDLYLNTIKKEYPEFGGDIGYFKLKTDTNPLPQIVYGIRLSKADKNHLFKYYMNKLVNLSILQCGSNADIIDIEYRVIDDSINIIDLDKLENEGFVPMDYKSIDETDYDFEEFYEKVEDEIAIETRNFLFSIAPESGEDQAKAIEAEAKEKKTKTKKTK